MNTPPVYIAGLISVFTQVSSDKSGLHRRLRALSSFYKKHCDLDFSNPFSGLTVLSIIKLKTKKIYQKGERKDVQGVIIILDCNLLSGVHSDYFFFFQIGQRESSWRPSMSFTNTLVYASSLAKKSDAGSGLSRGLGRSLCLTSLTRDYKFE